jgi:hypothetical protein
MLLFSATYILIGLSIAGAWINVEMRIAPRPALLLSFVPIFAAWPLLLLGLLAIAIAADRLDPHQREVSD